jgi:hypothetical protein
MLLNWIDPRMRSIRFYPRPNPDLGIVEKAKALWDADERG